MARVIAGLGCLAMLVAVGAAEDQDCPLASRTIVRKSSGTVGAVPFLCYKVDPYYTGEAAKRKIKGKVGLTATLGTDGCLHDMKVVKPLGYGLDESAVEALERWRYRRQPVAVPIRVEASFYPTSSRTPVTGTKCEELAGRDAIKSAAEDLR